MFRFLISHLIKTLKDERGFWGPIIGGTLAGAGGFFGAREQAGAAEEQARVWREIAQPQIDYMRMMLPYQERQMGAYTPYFEQAIGQQQRLLPYYGQTMEELGRMEVQPWEKRAVGEPFEKARQMLGERAAGARTLGAGATQKLATLYDIAQAEAMARMPYERRQQFVGMQPGIPQMPSVSMPGIPQMPTPYQAPEMDYGALGQMIGMGGFGGGFGSGFSPIFTPQATGLGMGAAGLQAAGFGLPFPVLY